MTSPATILVVDGEPNVRLSLQFLLSEAGYRVRTAADGSEALAEVARERPDLLLLDVKLPRIDGLTVCGRLKSEAAHRDLPIVFLSARTRDAERAKGLALGADDYIAKPFTADDLLSRIARALETRKQQ
jgi:DNA-binding response OmpR family regulator